jgi:ATP-dependent Clp protease adapter protein ClpS/histone H3/H4
MSKVEARAKASHREIIFHHDEETPLQFLIDLLLEVFRKPLADACRFRDAIRKEDKASCGSYPADIASEMLEAARQRIDDAGHPLRITSRATIADSLVFNDRCKLCGEPFANRISLNGNVTFVCDDCVKGITSHLPEFTGGKQFDYAYQTLASHFAGIPMDRLVSTSRLFPGHMRADVQAGVDRLFSTSPLRFFGIYEEHRYETLSFAALTRDGRNAPAVAPAQYHDVDVGDSEPVKCLENGLWLCRTDGDLRYAVVLSSHREYGHEAGTRIEIAVPAGIEGAEFAQRCFTELERAVNDARCYRGKVLSLDVEKGYSGRTTGIMVHKVPQVRRDDVILPDATLKLLDRNVLEFVGNRPKLRELGQSTRKGILLYGPPGTGKTHTIRYLASNLPDHTTLIITAAQIGAHAQYMSLARLLQPAMVVIEDADLVARDRDQMNSACDEVMLNELLNEMDGLKQDADILFVLTTNRPEQLESALASRPGRIDQAIEVPVPNEIGRKKLVQLYGRGLPLNDAVIGEAAQRTEGVSAAFIKELMRRVTQASIARDGGKTVESSDISLALDDMLFTGGKLNVKLLGGAREMARA